MCGLQGSSSSSPSTAAAAGAVTALGRSRARCYRLTTSPAVRPALRISPAALSALFQQQDKPCCLVPCKMVLGLHVNVWCGSCRWHHRSKARWLHVLKVQHNCLAAAAGLPARAGVACITQYKSAEVRLAVCGTFANLVFSAPASHGIRWSVRSSYMLWSAAQIHVPLGAILQLLVDYTTQHLNLHINSSHGLLLHYCNNLTGLW